MEGETDPKKTVCPTIPVGDPNTVPAPNEGIVYRYTGWRRVSKRHTSAYTSNRRDQGEQENGPQSLRSMDQLFNGGDDVLGFSFFSINVYIDFFCSTSLFSREMGAHRSVFTPRGVVVGSEARSLIQGSRSLHLAQNRVRRQIYDAGDEVLWRRVRGVLCDLYKPRPIPIPMCKQKN